MSAFQFYLDLLAEYWYVSVILLFLCFFRTPPGKGIIGEFLINLMTRLFLDGKEYHLLKNVTIPAGTGTTQIDHIVLSRFGIFVIETKNMKGWIFGGENQPKWTQKIYKHTTSFQNPLRQNYKHTKALADLINVDHKKIFSLIVFVGDSTFKTNMPENVTNGRHYITYIKSKRVPLFAEHEVVELVERIQERRLKPGYTNHRDHVNHVKALHSEKVEKDENVSILTKVLVKKVHGGRKQDSKFWQSDYSNIDIVPPESMGRGVTEKSPPSILIKGLFAIGVLVVCATLTIYFRPDILDRFPEGKLVSSLKNNFPSDGGIKVDIKSSPEPVAYRKPLQLETEPPKDDYSEDKIRKVVEEILKEKKGELSGERSKGKEIASRTDSYMYEIELFSGGHIFTDNATIEGEEIKYTGGNGLFISLDRGEVKSMKRFRVD